MLQFFFTIKLLAFLAQCNPGSSSSLDARLQFKASAGYTPATFPVCDEAEPNVFLCAMNLKYTSHSYYYSTIFNCRFIPSFLHRRISMNMSWLAQKKMSSQPLGSARATIHADWCLCFVAGKGLQLIALCLCDEWKSLLIGPSPSIILNSFYFYSFVTFLI